MSKSVLRDKSYAFDMKKIILFILFFGSCSLLTIYCKGQNTETIDSLKKVIPTMMEDTNKVNALNKLSELLNTKSYYKFSIPYTKEAYTLSNHLHFKKGIAVSNFNFGWSNISNVGRRDVSEVLKTINEAKDYFNKADDAEHVGLCYAISAAEYYRIEQNYPDAIKNYFVALKIFEKIDNKSKLANCYKDLSLVYMDQNDTTEALKYALLAYKSYEILKDSNRIAYQCNVIGMIYLAQNKNAEALDLILKGLKLYETLGTKGYWFGIPWTNGNVGDVYCKMGDDAFASGDTKLAKNRYDKAFEYYKNRYDYDSKNGNLGGPVNLQYGNLYSRLSTVVGADEKNEMLNKSKFYLQIALDSARTKDNYYNIYKSMSDKDTLEGNFKMAYRHYFLAKLYLDSLINDEKSKKSAMYKMQFETDKKEALEKAAQEAKDSRQRNIRNSIIV